jgi:hypothetical protein
LQSILTIIVSLFSSRLSSTSSDPEILSQNGVFSRSMDMHSLMDFCEYHHNPVLVVEEELTDFGVVSC